MSSKYLYIILLGLVALSKEFLVFNEEVLVLLAFGIFIYLMVNYGGEMIAGELDSRKEKIKEEFDLYKNLQEKTFTHLISYHKKQQSLSTEIKEVFDISKSEINNIEKYYENLFQNFLVSNFEERLKRVSINENKTNSALQKEIFVDLRAHLMDSYSIENGKMSKKNRKQLLKDCVEQLKTCS
jgi:F0F1-type ATP synthase membrane subunit b/b'|tara:strand:- start:570 stop:1118 length:549 start_codon:yes stop_codon:yes gene_type:complete